MINNKRERPKAIPLIFVAAAFLLIMWSVLRFLRIDWPFEFYLATLLSLLVFLLPLPTRLPTFLGLIFLSFCPLLLSFGNRLLAERSAAVAFIFFVGGVLRALPNLYRRDKNEGGLL